jgi:putative oxidoreductase
MGKETDAQARQMEMVQFFKDLGPAGAALILLGVFAEFGDQIGLALTGPLFG